jgi:hypothetical protein
MRRAVAALACLSLLALIAAPGEHAAADEPYPSKPIRFVLPQPAGGAVDLIARALGDRLSYAMRQPVIREPARRSNSLKFHAIDCDTLRRQVIPISWGQVVAFECGALG